LFFLLPKGIRPFISNFVWVLNNIHTQTILIMKYGIHKLALAGLALAFAKGATNILKGDIAGEKTDGVDPEERLNQLGIVLPEASSPVANYVNAVRSGKLLFMSGKGPDKPEGGQVTGKVGSELTVEEGYEAARLTGIQLLAAMKSELGSLSRVRRIVKVLGMVNGDPLFAEHPKVINGVSDLMVEVFGERGKHARSAVGMGSLPGNIAVEVEMIVEVQ
jgi:enamine deaminase RidA (YjgF/YER057c/UK114 family)